MEKYFQGVRWLNMYIYQLTYEDEGSLLMIGYFGSWKKARSVMKKYRSTLPGFKEYPNCFIIKKMKVNKDNYYFLQVSQNLKISYGLRYQCLRFLSLQTIHFILTTAGIIVYAFWSFMYSKKSCLNSKNP